MAVQSQSGVSLSLKGNGMEKLLKKIKMYPKGLDQAIAQSTFAIEKIAKTKYTLVVDGSPTGTTAATRTYPRRTLIDGVRKRTGNLASGILTRFKHSNGIRVEGAVGINAPYYGVEHERRGRNREKGYYPFLWPSLRDAKPQIKKVFETILKSIERRKV